jgi:hypothetical protein
MDKVSRIFYGIISVITFLCSILTGWIVYRVWINPDPLRYFYSTFFVFMAFAFLFFAIGTFLLAADLWPWEEKQSTPSSTQVSTSDNESVSSKTIKEVETALKSVLPPELELSGFIRTGYLGDPPIPWNGWTIRIKNSGILGVLKSNVGDVAVVVDRRDHIYRQVFVHAKSKWKSPIQTAIHEFNRNNPGFEIVLMPW